MFIKITLVFQINLNNRHIGTFKSKWKLKQTNGSIANSELHASSEAHMWSAFPHYTDSMEVRERECNVRIEIAKLMLNMPYLSKDSD